MSSPAPQQPERRFPLNEDWLATIVGLVLLVLILAGVVPGWLVP
ncbi:hypothetical protein [Nocardia asteroides]|nr:hypothetical protein [Nocardia asteroides]